MRFSDVYLEAVECFLPPNVMSSARIETRMGAVYDRLKLPYGRLEMMTGIRERRFWNPGTRSSTVAAEAGKIALQVSGVDPSEIGVLIHASVCRDFLEPATASVVHHHLGLPKTAAAFDLSNACLGVLSSMVQVATMIQGGLIEAGLVVSGEVAEPLHEATLKRILNDKHLTRQSFKMHFASLTIGSGAVGVVLTNKRLAKKKHKFLGGALRTDSHANELCQEDTSEAATTVDGPLMATDSEALLHAGVNLAATTWAAAKDELGWTNDTPDHVFTHQVGVAHQRLLFDAIGVSMEKDFPTVGIMGNTGSAALPTALSIGMKEKKMNPGQKLALMGIGSGLSSLMLGVEVGSSCGPVGTVTVNRNENGEGK